MPSANNTFDYIAEKVDIYFGLFLLIFGVLGGIFNVIIFTSLKTFRETTCAFYLTIVSIVNTGQLLTALPVRILSDGFNTDIRSRAWVCKCQIYIAAWCALVSLTIMCLAVIDQYLSMSVYRHYCTQRIARRSIVCTCLIWALYCICLLVYWDAPAGICTSVNRKFAIYVSHFHFPVLLGFLPLTTMTTFSFLAFSHARTLIRRNINVIRLSRDRQLTAMTLCHVLYVVLATLPYIIFFINSLNQIRQDSEHMSRINLIHTITALFSYSTFSVSLFFLVWKRKCSLLIDFLGVILHLLLRIRTFSKAIDIRLEEDLDEQTSTNHQEFKHESNYTTNGYHR